MRLLGSLLSIAAIAFLGCGPTSPAAHPRGVDVSSAIEGIGGNAPALEPNRFRIRASACEGIDLRPQLEPEGEKSLLAFLTAANVQFNVQRARADLIYLDVLDAGTVAPVRLRLAILKSREEAGRELHEAIMQHGRGSFGFHRSNLAVLAPVAPLPDAIAFSLRTKLACWGVLTVAAADEDFVVAGGYAEP